MSDFKFLIAAAVIAFLAGILYYMAWRWSAGANTIAKALVRYVVPILAFAGVGYALLTPTLQMADKGARPNVTKRFEYRRPKPPEKKKPATIVRKKSTQGTGGSGAGISGAAPETLGAPGGGGGGANIEAETAEEVAETAAEPEASEEEEVSVTAKPPPPPSPQEPPATAAPSAVTTSEVTGSKDWDLVPVFYGTDRARSDKPKRLDYDGNRGRRLELGHAMVSVPKSHQVPNIERPWAVRIPYFNVTIYEEAEDPKKHFVLQEIKALSRADFLKVVRQRLANSKTFKDQAFVFVHGFNTSFENGVYRTAQIAYDLKFDGAPFVYSWPSGGGVASYTYDRESSGQSTPYMRDFLKLVINETGAKAVSVIAHSMGNQPVLQVLRDLKNATPDDVVISQIILAAPDVDRHNFENIAKEILGLAKGVTLYVASNDQALQYSRQFHGGVARAGDVPAEGPVIIPGIDTIDITAASTDSLGINHSGYAENNALLKDIGRLMATGAPPNERNPPKFERVEQGEGSGYWRYPTARE